MDDESSSVVDRGATDGRRGVAFAGQPRPITADASSRTRKQDKPFNAPAVLTILRNRPYLGEIYVRGRHYPAPHQPLIDLALPQRAQEILAERGEDCSLRRSNQSDYLLTGLVECARCGKRYIGAAAHGHGAAIPTTSASPASATAARAATPTDSPPDRPLLPSLRARHHARARLRRPHPRAHHQAARAPSPP
jgi:hypothetical protein